MFSANARCKLVRRYDYEKVGYEFITNVARLPTCYHPLTYIYYLMD